MKLAQMVIEKKLEHQRITRIARSPAFKLPPEIMLDKGLREGVDYTLVIIEETSENPT